MPQNSIFQGERRSLLRTHFYVALHNMGALTSTGIGGEIGKKKRSNI